eukprot:TRINITY_DN3539_c0_g1_i1.p1 TRINITY_DN3539_c0_g1~~TRINITY_DN3539_c0_g1_i1.p1  ORF type:complete len:1312 (-),score=419.30 TRINITY_DN3539_c0_g1_i1:598-4533(-)
MSRDVLSLINYFGSHGLPHHILTVCKEVQKNRNSVDPQILFWLATAHLLEGDLTEASQILENEVNDREMMFPQIEALIHCYKNTQYVDHDAVSSLEVRRHSAQSEASDNALKTAASFNWHAKNTSEARQIVDKVINRSPEDIDALILRGWIDLTDSNNSVQMDSIRQFKKAEELSIASGTDKLPLDLLMGMARHAQLKQSRKSIEYFHQAIVHYQWFLPALVEKAKTHVSLREWTEALDAANRVLAEDSFDIEALRISVLYTLCRTGDISKAQQQLGELIDSVCHHEPKNVKLMVNIVRPLMRLSSGNRALLQQLLGLLQRAASIEDSYQDVHTEMGYLLYYLGDHSGAETAFSKAIECSGDSLEPHYGMVLVYLARDQIAEAQDQHQFVSVLQQDSCMLSFINGILVWKQLKDANQHIRHVQEAQTKHIESLGRINHGVEYYSVFDPMFLMQVAREYLIHCNQRIDADVAGDNIANVRLTKLLEKLIKEVPGNLEATMMLARVKFNGKQNTQAEKLLSRVTQLDPSQAEPHLMLAEMKMEDDKLNDVENHMNNALSADFEVQNKNIHYRILDLQLALKKEDKKQSIQKGKMALKLLKNIKKTQNVDLATQCGVYLRLAEAYALNKKFPDASKVIQAARRIFHNTPEESNVIIVHADVALAKNAEKGGDKTIEALGILNEISSDSIAFPVVLQKKAHIFLKLKNNRKKYVDCFKELVASSPTVGSYIMLGDAYLEIQEPEKAIESYGKALELRPNDSSLSTKIGEALVNSHDYSGAIEYYLRAMKSSDSGPELCLKLADLYMNLGKYTDASSALTGMLLRDADNATLGELKQDVKILSLLAKIHEAADSKEKTMVDLTNALARQKSILSQVRSDPEAVREIRVEASETCVELGRICEVGKDDAKAISHYNNAIKFNETDETSRFALAKLYLRKGDLSACQQQCITLLKMTENSEVSIMLANIMFKKQDYTTALFHYDQVLSKKPTNFEVLKCALDLMRRTGRLEEAEMYFNMAEVDQPMCIHAAGYAYCKGLHSKYMNNVHDAIKHFNLARKSGDYGINATYNMVRLYISPDNEKLWKSGQTESKDLPENIKTADKLLGELAGPEGDKTMDHKILECLVLISTRQKHQIESAIKRLLRLIEEQNDHPGSHVALAIAYMIDKRVPKARNQLKRLLKQPYSQKFADEFEDCWLLLADMYVQNGKFDLALGLCDKVLSFNCSCAKAYEIKGFINEKELSYRDAAANYEMAWKYEFNRSAGIGYKLGYNYLKAKQYVEAIDICHEVLKQFPDYPKMRSDILIPARSSIRQGGPKQ